MKYTIAVLIAVVTFAISSMIYTVLFKTLCEIAGYIETEWLVGCAIFFGVVTGIACGFGYGTDKNL